MKVISILIVGLFCVVNVVEILGESLIVETHAGRIRGLKAGDGNYSMFLGIPYAKVDHNNPFGPSVPHPKFEETFDANDDSSLCPQVQELIGTIAGNLDCLRLNIYVPESSTKQRLPVLILIHGGGLSSGFAGRFTYGPKYLVRHGVILVTFNYRLGPYGFMCLHTPSVPGNQGLKDQLAALRWIRENIEAFGGDVENVTVFGESAGGRSIDLHLMSPQEKLFQRAIIQSGSVLNPGWFPEPDVEAPIKVAAALGFTTNNIDDAISYLANVDPSAVIDATMRTNILFRLCVEKDFENVEKFITNHPLNVDVEKASGTTILIGYTSQEMLASYVNRQPEFYENLNLFNDQLTLSFNFESELLVDLERIMRKFYIGDEALSENVKFELADFASDTIYVHSTVRNIARYLRNGVEKMYYFVFSYDGGRNYVKRLNNITVGGACHADERGYLYDVQLFAEEPSIADRQMIDRMTTMWTNFAKFGDPTPEITELLPVKWEPITEASPYHYLNIDAELTTGMRPFHRRLSFWDLFYATYWEYQFGYNDPNGSMSLYMNHFYLIISCALHQIFYDIRLG